MIFDRIPRIWRALLIVCRCNLRIAPSTGVEPVTDMQGFRWKSTSIGAGFGISIWRPVSGWLIARIRFSHDFTEPPALRLCIDSGKSDTNGEELRLIPVADKEYEALAYFGSGIRHARFIPGDCEGQFSIEKFELYNVPRLFVRHFGLQALSAHHRAFPGAAKRMVKKALLEQSRNTGISLDKILEAHIRSLIEPRGSADYETWIQDVEIPYNEAQRKQADDIHGRAGYEPLISILLPVFDPPEAFFRECLRSVLDQIYTKWELCIVDDASSLPYVREITEEYEQMDERVRAINRTSNGGISAASNTALEMARGHYVVLLDHDDTLASNALLSVIEALQGNPRPRVLYSDEDKIDTEGRRYSPHFKGNWNPDLLYSQNYVSHLGVYETKLVRNIGGFREGFEGSQDHDLILRASANVNEREIYHIPLVLYHWRASPRSTAGRAGAKLYAWDAGVRALSSFFKARGRSVSVERGPVPFTYRAKWPVPQPDPLVSIIIPTRDNPKLLAACISSVLEKTTYSNFEIVIVNNNSQNEETLNYLAQIKENNRIRLLDYPGTFDFSAINNFAAIEAKGELLCLLNDDIEVIEPDWLTEMVSHACRPEIGCVGAKLVYPDGRVQHGGLICGICGIAGHAHKYFTKERSGYFSRLQVTQNISAVTAACLVLRRSVWERLGGMNSEDLKVAFNDVDLCLRIRCLGFRNVWTPYALLVHHESASRGPEQGLEKEERFFNEKNYMLEKWGGYLEKDPYYSPHLTREREDFSLSISPYHALTSSSRN
jgi:glycosyltransferase involved in cell wall biosynthesis